MEGVVVIYESCQLVVVQLLLTVPLGARRTRRCFQYSERSLVKLVSSAPGRPVSGDAGQRQACMVPGEVREIDRSIDRMDGRVRVRSPTATARAATATDAPAGDRSIERSSSRLRGCKECYALGSPSAAAAAYVRR